MERIWDSIITDEATAAYLVLYLNHKEHKQSSISCIGATTLSDLYDSYEAIKLAATYSTTTDLDAKIAESGNKSTLCLLILYYIAPRLI